MDTDKNRVTRRERLALTVVALLPTVSESFGALAEQAGRLMWVVPVAALPFGVLISRCWTGWSHRTFFEGLDFAFGKRVGRWVKWLYFLWGVCLLIERAMSYGERLTASAREERTRWLYLAVGLFLCLWICGKRGVVLARAGKLCFLLVTVTLGGVLLARLPRVELYKVLPQGGEGRGLLSAIARTVGLVGYGVFSLCLPISDDDTKGIRWAIWCSLGYAALALAMVGTLGAGLTAELSEPFFRLAQGIKGDGLQGEALVGMVLTLCDWGCVSLLAWGCGGLWRELTGSKRGFSIVVTAAFLTAGVLGTRSEGRVLGSEWLTCGNLAVGFFVPAVVCLRCKRRERVRRTQDKERNDGNRADI